MNYRVEFASLLLYL